jgi:hypothetical protein
LYFSTANNISTISNLYLHFKRYYEDIKNILPPQVENPEIAFFEYINQNGIIPRQYRFNFTIKRYNSKYDISLVNTTSQDRKMEKRIVGFLYQLFPLVIKRKIKGLLLISTQVLNYVSYLDQKNEN